MTGVFAFGITTVTHRAQRTLEPGLFAARPANGTKVFGIGSPEHHDRSRPCTPGLSPPQRPTPLKEDTMKKIIVRKTGSIRLTAPCQTHYNLFAF
ncbi:hypothetical protein [Streptomyces sp. NPDC056670]|uniref:hypothetical protein n=1 Tax=Streptomyces sp. NPDC056670 TaxID=3345904 RepID=UPI0036C047B1